MKRKLIYLVIDGAADRLSDPVTSLELANKPGLDYIARNGLCGLMYPIARGVAPESDAAVLSILGYEPEKIYPGRGPLEALGAGVEFKPGYEVAFRANFATIDPGTLTIVDRRVGRSLSTNEAVELAKAINGLRLGVHDGYVKVKATVGHRAVVVIGSGERRLSSNVSNNDPAYVRRGLISEAAKSFENKLRDVEPLDDTAEAKAAAQLVNEFVKKAISILSEHPVNKSRRSKGLLPANALLIRDAGCELPTVEPLQLKYGRRFAVIAEMPVELGIGRFLKAYVREVSPPVGNPEYDYSIRLEATLELLKDNDVVYVHLKGPDEPGHDGDVELKVEKIENIDKYFVQRLLNSIDSDVAILVTADHATPPSVKAHTDDPVPVALYYKGIVVDKAAGFTEKECSKGSLGVIEHGWLLLDRVLKIIE
ncbi:MAG: alkaline phosphatase family protein [Sulfolobales archaeon]|nr:alkaline phosphatase family protein [Sulfolobales archaeon]MCX8199218.1 alkaline phosphatase family protein [Sulfolobales archaeon]MDW8170198.1 2,3-bisphosphoglycerate-independent phosphoglycerate mutase [Desulfurococcaceae archaeon]